MNTSLPAPARCRDCHAPIHWGRTPRGKQIPIDAEPANTKAANTTLLEHHGVLYADRLTGRQLAATRASTRPLYTCHYDTCPKRNPQ